jgi:pimeloyl-ACP methyl ester carboxylesterase
MIGLLALMGIALTLLLAVLTAILAWEMVRPPRQTLAWAVARKVAADPGEAGLRFEEWWLDRLNPPQARLAVWEIEGTGQGNAGLTAVFLHGWGKSRITSLQRIGPFVPLVDRLVLYDLRGHGESTGSSSRLGDDEDDDLLALLDRVNESGRFLLVGHSMGAVIALKAAAKASGQRPEIRGQPAPLIAGVIAYAPYVDFDRSLRGRLRVHGYPTRPLTDLAMLIHRLLGLRPAGVDVTQAASIDVPLLVVHGVDDVVAPVEDARRIVRAVNGAILVEIEDAAHADAHRVDEARHAEVVREFVMRLRNQAVGTCASLK